MSESELDVLGPVDYLVVEFPADKADFSGAMAAELTALALPADVSPKLFRDRVKAQGILVAAGLGPYDGTGFRVGHMGDIRMVDVERTLVAIAAALSETTAPQ